MAPQLPLTHKAWQITSTVRDGIENALTLNPRAPIPTPKPTEHLVQIIAVPLNPVDYKPAENVFLNYLTISKPATPGLDFSGRIITPAAGSSFKRGQLVFGNAGTLPFIGGALAEFAIAEEGKIAAIPEGVDPVEAATLTVTGITAYQSIAPYVKEGDSVFINGGSGGVGVFGIQIAKMLGCHVTASCSTKNVEFCKSLGADEVVDYREGNVVDALRNGGRKFDHVVDNVAHDTNLYFSCHLYTKPGAVYSLVGGYASLKFAQDAAMMLLWPGFLGGGKRKLSFFMPKLNEKDLDQLAEWLKLGKLKVVIDQKFTFEEATKAFEKLKTGRAKGKIIVDVASKTYMQTSLD